MESRKKSTKHVNITLSFPSDLTELLHAKVENRGMSRYIANAVRDALKRDELLEMQKLEAAYEEANKDPDRQKVIEEWKAIDADNTVADWEW